MLAAAARLKRAFGSAAYPKAPQGCDERLMRGIGKVRYIDRMRTLKASACCALVSAVAVFSCKDAPPPDRTHGDSSSNGSIRPAEARRAAESAGPDVLALLGGLKPADKLGSLDVVHISPVIEGSVAIDLGSGVDRGSIFFVELGDGPLPPASSEKYGVYYRELNEPHRIGTEALQSACIALADRLRKNEATQPKPAGLTVFSADKPKSKSERPL